MPSALRIVAVLSVAGAVAACGSSATATRDGPPPGTSVAASMGLPGSRADQERGETAPETAPAAVPQGQASASGAPAGPQGPPPQVAARPPALTRHQLQDLAPENVTQALGEPELVRREPPAEVWQYAVENCVVDIFFYNRGAGLKVAHVEGRDRRGRESSADRCLESLQQRPGTPTS
ncbi:MAG: hypothetical protein JNK11_04035 [Alphaproteobacteria bacterium]|nr:hypothetical protein [Alphaproteobacteria bacterium]